LLGIAVAAHFITAADGGTIKIEVDGETTDVSLKTTSLTCHAERFRRDNLDYDLPHKIVIQVQDSGTLAIHDITCVHNSSPIPLH
jgi:hypothetical protein